MLALPEPQPRFWDLLPMVQQRLDNDYKSTSFKGAPTVSPTSDSFTAPNLPPPATLSSPRSSASHGHQSKRIYYDQAMPSDNYYIYGSSSSAAQPMPNHAPHESLSSIASNRSYSDVSDIDAAAAASAYQRRSHSYSTASGPLGQSLGQPISQHFGPQLGQPVSQLGQPLNQLGQPLSQLGQPLGQSLGLGQPLSQQMSQKDVSASVIRIPPRLEPSNATTVHSTTLPPPTSTLPSILPIGSSHASYNHGSNASSNYSGYFRFGYSSQSGSPAQQHQPSQSYHLSQEQQRSNNLSSKLHGYSSNPVHAHVLHNGEIVEQPHPGTANPTTKGAPPEFMTTFSSKMAGRNQKKHICTVCSKGFTRPSSLQTHSYSHTGEKPYTCDGCGRQFSVISNLRRHKRIHGLDR